MNHPLYQYLCCPRCKKKLIKHTRGLLCRNCKEVYTVKNGIPILVNLNTLPDHLTRQITYFEKEDANRTNYVSEPWQKRYVDNFVAIGAPKTKALIIDNATGSGYMAIELAKKGYSIIACDLTFAELTKLNENKKKFGLALRILAVCATSEVLPVCNGVADGMVANAILEHLPNEKGAIDEMRRVLKKNAPLMLAMPIKLGYVWPFLWPVNISHDRKIGHLRRYTRARILRIFTGFIEMKTYYTGSLVKVACLVLKILTKNRKWDEISEQIDGKFSGIAYGSSNVVSVLRKQ